MIKCLETNFIVYWQTEYKNISSIRYLCLRSVLDFVQSDISHNSRTYKLQKEEFRIEELDQLRETFN